MSGSGDVVESSQARFLLLSFLYFLKSKRGPRPPNYLEGQIRRRQEPDLAVYGQIRLLKSPDPVLPHHLLRHSKSLTSSPARAGLALDPIQRLLQTRQGRVWLPGQNDRRYGNARVALPPWLHATRTPRGPLSPEARYCAARGGGGGGVHRSMYGRVGTQGGVPPWVPHHAVQGPGYTPTPPPRASQ